MHIRQSDRIKKYGQVPTKKNQLVSAKHHKWPASFYYKKRDGQRGKVNKSKRGVISKSKAMRINKVFNSVEK